MENSSVWIVILAGYAMVSGVALLRGIGVLRAMLLLGLLAGYGWAFGDEETVDTCADRPVSATPELIAQGRMLFFDETFNGNGRTCGTCHREDHNFTIDADYIRRLPKSDPLFVFERVPELKELENGALLRSRGLILENLDGFDRPPVFRAVQQTLGLSQTMSIGVIDSVNGLPVHETGWSGDGAPGDGSLRCFAVGAIVQHAPKTLQRRPGIDFRWPTSEELDALLAFQLSLGRQETPPLSTMQFVDPDVQMGAFKFSNAVMRTRAGGTDARRCGGCHVNGGAGDQEPVQIDRQRVTNVAGGPNAPICTGQATTIDGGLGASVEFTETIKCGRRTVDAPFFADIDQAGLHGSFNISSLWEAVETAPFFHDHSAKSVEDVLRFYESDAFNESEGNEGRAFVFTPDDRRQLAKLLRVMSILENIRSALAYIDHDRIDLALIDIGEANDAALAVPVKWTRGGSPLIKARNAIRRDPSSAAEWLRVARAGIVR